MRPALYFHIPYCRLRCTYCNFYFELGRADSRLIDAFRAELKLRDSLLPAGPLPGIYLGGGTPSWLPAQQLAELKRVVVAAAYGHEIGLIINAGHGLHCDNVTPISRIPQLVELNIGHAIIGREVFVGLAAAVSEIKALMNDARKH